MNIDKPVSTIMTAHLKTVQAGDSLMDVKEIFEKYNVHHVPVVDSKCVIGMISQYDFNHFVSGKARSRGDELLEEARLRAWTTGEVMTKDLTTVKPSDSIRHALEYFRRNQFHALPVVEENNKLVGIVTTFDVLDSLLDQEPAPIHVQREG